MTELEQYELILLEVVGVNDAFLSGAICIGGYNLETLSQVLYYHTGYRDFDSFKEFETADDEE